MITEPVESCETEIRVRYAEVDRMGVVHHSRFWVYFEMGRTELLRANGVDYRSLEEQGVFFVVVRCSAKFISPARYDDGLTLTTRTTKTHQAKLDHSYELKRLSDAALVATGETTLACVNAQGQVMAIPDFVRSPSRPSDLR